MSLLLDALKKAAEQKAQKSQSEQTPDETLLDAAADDATRQTVSGDGSARQADDETEFEHSELGTRLDRSGRARGAGDDTRLEALEKTETRTVHSQPGRSTDDETGLDMPDATKTNFQRAIPEHSVEDETGLDIPQTEDIEDSGEDDLPGDMRSEDDETIVIASQDAPNLEPGSRPVVRERSTNDDETDLSQLAAEADFTENRGQSVDSAVGGDETDLSQSLKGSDTEDDKVVASDSEAIDPSQPIQGSAQSGSEKGAVDGDDTDFKQPPVSGDQVEAASASLPLEEDSEDGEDSVTDDEAVVDEDLSLLLIEPETTNPGLDANTSFTQPQIPEDRGLALEEMTPGQEKRSLGDSPQDKAVEEQADSEEDPTLTNPTATALYADDTRTSQSAATVARVDTTSTRTYAPDNYDRTLMRVPSDDASKIFAGMKSDSDVVMTPDYAKKVFQSKTSVQRVQHYRLYTGIALVLVLAIGFYGVLEYQDQSEQIDGSLLSLKRDPMPGVIRIAQPEKTEMFVETEALTKARTLEIIESANQTESIPEAQEVVSETEVIDAAPVSQPEITAAPSEPATSKTATSEPQAPAPVQAKQPPATRDDSDQIAGLTSSVPSTARTDAKHNMHITSNSQYQQTDIWLREAYAAYGIGDNQLALSLYNKVLEVDSANRNALLARAAIHMQDGKIDAAIRDYQALLLANPKDSLAMSSLLAVGSFSPQETESQLKLMIRETPDSPYLNFALANAYGAQKRWQEAQPHYFTALQNNPSDPNYAYNLAVSLEHISQPSSAITYYQRALDNFTNGLATFNRDVVNQRLEILGKL